MLVMLPQKVAEQARVVEIQVSVMLGGGIACGSFFFVFHSLSPIS